MVAYFSNDFQLINIEKTAIIVALGIDKADEDLEVSVQIAVPQASNQNSTNSDAILSAKDKTLYGALEKISLQTGWYPKLTFCNLIIMGQDLVKENFTPIIDYILTSNRFQNSAVIAVSEKSAKETLKSTTPLDFVSSFALQKILLRNLDRTSSVLVTDIRKLCALSRSHSEFCYMPLIKTVKTEDKEQGDLQTSIIEQSLSHSEKSLSTSSSDGSSGDSSGGQSNSGGASENKPSVFDASNTLIFSKGELKGVFSSTLTHCFNIITKEVKETFIPIEFIRGQKKINALISVVTNKYSVKLKIKEGVPKVIVELTLVCEKEETYDEQNITELAKFNKVSKEGISALEEKLTNDIIELIEYSKTTKCDYLELKELLYRSGNKNYATFKDNLLDLLEYEVRVKCKNYR
jgi:spore germination protein KC